MHTSKRVHSHILLAFTLAIRKLGALIDLDQLQLTPGCHQEEKINIPTHAKKGQNILHINSTANVWPCRSGMLVNSTLNKPRLKKVV